MIATQFRVTTTCAAGSRTESTHTTSATAAAAAAQQEAEIQAWIDDEGLPDQRLYDETAEHWSPSSEVVCEQYAVGDDDIAGDPVAQAVVEAAIASPHVRWPTRRHEGGERDGRPVRLLFADSPVLGHWQPLLIEDSEAMLAWFIAHDIEYPALARQARGVARQYEHIHVASQRQEQCWHDAEQPLGAAVDRVRRARAELAAAEAVQAAAEAAAVLARQRRDDNIRWHAEALARRPAVV